MKQSLFIISYLLLTCGIINFTFYSFNKVKNFFIMGTLSTLISFFCLFCLLINNLIEYKFSFETLLNSPYKHFSFLVILSYFIGEYRWRVRLLSLLMLPFSLLTMTLAIFYDNSYQTNIFLNPILTYLHVTLLMISFSLILLAFSSSVIYLLKIVHLKNHNAPAHNYPALEKITKMIKIPFNIGWITMTIGILLSIISLGELTNISIKLILGGIIWLIYTYYFINHNLKRYNFISLAKGSILLFILLIIFFIFSSFSPQLIENISYFIREINLA